jgi:biotin carboxyl carrier protein
VTSTRPQASPYRPQAVAAASAPERLDTLLRITPPRLWLALAALVVAIAAAGVWSVLGQAPTLSNGVGVLLPAEGIFQLTATQTGTVTTSLVRRGQAVAVGQRIAVLRGPDGGRSDVRSTVAGTILLLLIKEGSFVTPGTPLAQVIPAGAGDTAELFVPVADDKELVPGMDAEVSPVTAPAAQYGSIRAKVVAVSRIPFSSDRIRLLVGGNDALAQDLSSVGPAVEVQLRLARDPRNRSGYAWTSGRGPPYDIDLATLLTGSIVVARGHPVRQLLGGGQ